ncbi:RNA 2'-phosphotransferase [Fusobacterium sp. PH5-44]|uniref:RNA 2'-phosphotransferase n=1 Tax=unclassified Fusobacterium TaxID=2648384 RepID=UPI003D19D243
MNNKTLVKKTNTIGIISIFLLIYWVFIFVAIKVGERHGIAVVLEILSEDMYNDEFQFFISENGVWLTEFVPVKYLRKK